MHYFKYDWAKTIAIDDDRVFCAGGAIDYRSSDDAFIVNVKTGFTKQMPKMTSPRQGHGIALACGYVYCCAGFNRALGYDGELASCERFSLIEHKWNNDVPNMPRE